MTQSPGLSWLVPKAVRFSLGSLGRRKSQESPRTKLRSGVHPRLEPVLGALRLGGSSSPPLGLIFREFDLPLPTSLSSSLTKSWNAGGPSRFWRV